MAAWDSHELGRMVYKYGGSTVGSMTTAPGRVECLAPTTAHALFYDWTHDNPSPGEKRTIRDMLPSAGTLIMISINTHDYHDQVWWQCQRVQWAPAEVMMSWSRITFTWSQSGDSTLAGHRSTLTQV